MRKKLLVILIALIAMQSATAQSTKDTLLSYHDKWGHELNSKDSASYFILIMPEDTITHLSTVNEYFANGKPKLTSKSSIRNNSLLKFEGGCISYYSNGRRASITNYKGGKLLGAEVDYYPNGKLYCVELFDYKKRKLIACRDTSGNILTDNGSGEWLQYNADFTAITIEGTVKDSLMNGEWDGLIAGKVVTKNQYKDGAFVSGVYIDNSGSRHKYNTFNVEPSFKNGPADFNAYLAKNVKFPEYDRQHNLAGRVIMTFVVEQDGTLTHVKAVKSPDEYMGQAATDAIANSPAWTPGIQNGQPVRVQYTIAFFFDLSNVPKN